MSKAVSKTNCTVYATEENKDGMYIPAAVGGHVVLSLLRAKKEAHADAPQKAIVARNIDHSKPLADMNWNWYAVQALLKTQELNEMANQPKGAVIDGTSMVVKDITDIVTRSAELNVLLLELIRAQAAKLNKR